MGAGAHVCAEPGRAMGHPGGPCHRAMTKELGTWLFVSMVPVYCVGLLQGAFVTALFSTC